MTSDSYDYLRFLQRFKSHWAQEAAKAITKAHRDVPEDATLGDRTKIIDTAYPFGERRYTPYKQWLKVRREYLTLFGYERKGTPKVGRVREEMPGLPIIYESLLERSDAYANSAALVNGWVEVDEDPRGWEPGVPCLYHARLERSWPAGDWAGALADLGLDEDGECDDA